MNKTILAFAITVLSLDGTASGATRCEELPPSISDAEYQQFIAESIKAGNIPPKTYQQPALSRCYIEPDGGLVPDEQTAKAIASAILKTHFRPRDSFKRLVLEAEPDISADWIVTGHYPGPGVRQKVPTVWISRKDGRVLGFWYD